MGETRDHRDGCLGQGLYAKYRVERTDGTDQPGGRHHGCWYFVLDPTHDPDARAVLYLYAELVGEERRTLHADLWARPELASNPAPPSYNRIRTAVERVFDRLTRRMSPQSPYGTSPRRQADDG